MIKMIDDNIINIDLAEIEKLSLWMLSFLMLFSIFPFFYVWSDKTSESISELGILIDESFLLFIWTLIKSSIIFLLFLIAGLFVHEFIHMIFFALFIKSKFSGVQFGYDSEKIIPYVHIKEEISIRGFRIGVLMPGIILGIIPLISGMVQGYLGIFLFGLFFTMGASGDLLILWHTRHVGPFCLIKDLPDKIGVKVIT